ncbi:MAG TPA: hypothetical protein PLQ49_00870, partial [Methanothrix sp.]|nr:hypothetical protein [Methanothrix sp.]
MEENNSENYTKEKVQQEISSGEIPNADTSHTYHKILEFLSSVVRDPKVLLAVVTAYIYIFIFI